MYRVQVPPMVYFEKASMVLIVDITAGTVCEVVGKMDLT
jgi:hypothetical protein